MGSPLRSVLKVAVSNPKLEFQPRRVRLPPLSPPRVVNSSLRSVQDSRIPHKYDHFHEKTYEVDFVPKFYVKRFERKPGQVCARPLELLHAFRLATGKRAVRNSRAHSVITRRSPSKSPTPMRKEATLSSAPARPLQRMILCVQDGAELESPALRTLTLDLGSLLHRCFGNITPNRKVADALSQHALEEVIERATLSLHPTVAFSALYYVTGERVVDVVQVPADCKVLVAGWIEGFRGLR